MPPLRVALAQALAVFAAGCSTVGGVGFSPMYPSRPPATPGDALADPTPSRVVVHATVTSAALKSALEDKLPKTGEGTFPLLGAQRKVTWRREPVELRFTQGRLAVSMHVVATAEMPIGHIDLPIDLAIFAEPVVTSDYVARMQSTDVTVTSTDRVVKLADAAAGILDKVKSEVDGQLRAFAFDLRPLIAGAYERLGKPIEIPLGEARGCASMRVLPSRQAPPCSPTASRRISRW